MNLEKKIIPILSAKATVWWKTNCIIFIFFFTVSNSLQSQTVLDDIKIDFEISAQTLPDILWNLSEESAIPIAFSDNDFSKAVFSFSFQKKSIRQILSTLLADSGLSFTYQNQQVLIIKKPISKITLSGYIEDAESGERLIGANIFEPISKRGTASNEYGFFSITLPADKKTITISYLGYKTQEILLKSIQHKSQIIALQAQASSTFQEIIITDKLHKTTTSNPKKLDDFLLEQDIETLPMLGGETDILQLVQQSTGIQRGTDGFGGLHVRGGNADQNLVFLDGVPIYNPYHVLGLYSIFDSKIVKRVKFLKGRFPSRYGGRISSVVDVRTKDGNNKTYHGHASVGLISSKVALEGPLKKEQGAFFISARRSHVDPFLKSYSKNSIENESESRQFNYYFGEVIGKLNYTINPQNRIYLSFYKGGDNYKNQHKDIINENEPIQTFTESKDQHNNWGNTLGVFRWNQQHNERLFSNLTFTYSRFNFLSIEKTGFEEGNISSTDFYQTQHRSKIETISGKIDFDFVPNAQHYLRWGIIGRYNRFAPGLSGRSGSLDEFSFDSPIFEPIENTIPIISTKELNVYLEDEWQLSPTLGLNAGLFSSLVAVENKNYILLDPRFTLHWQIANPLSLQFSINKMNQTTNVLTRSGAGFPNDLWVPVTAKIKPQQAWIVDAHFLWKIKEGWFLGAELYYKKMKNLLDYKADTNFFPQEEEVQSIDWENNVTLGTGKSRGIELSLVKEIGKIKGRLAYTLSKTDRQFPDINNGESFPFRLDQRHIINTIITYKFNKKINLTGIWNFSSGNHTNIALNEWEYPNNLGGFVYYDYGKKNSFKLPNYHRLDIAFHFKNPTSWGHWSLSLGANNVYNRKNIYAVKNSAKAGKYTAISLIPFLPYFSFNISL